MNKNHLKKVLLSAFAVAFVLSAPESALHKTPNNRTPPWLQSNNI
jgi:hypothetical protein